MRFFKPTKLKVLLAIVLFLIPVLSGLGLMVGLFSIVFILPIIIIKSLYESFVSYPLYNFLASLGIHFSALQFVFTSLYWLILAVIAYLFSCIIVYFAHMLKKQKYIAKRQGG